MRVCFCLMFLLLSSSLVCQAAPFPIKEVPGPDKDIQGFVLTEKEWSSPIGSSAVGTLSLWFKTDKTYGGAADTPTAKVPILTAGDLFTLRIQTAQGRAMLIWEWGKGVKGCDNLNIQIPSLPGPAWYHVYYCWDAKQGFFTGYLNGTPLRLEGTKLPAWEMGKADNIVLHQSALAFADLIASPTCNDYADTRAFLTDAILDNMAQTLGGKFRPTVDLQPRKGDLLCSYDLTDATQTARWVMEGPGQATYDEQGMTMVSTVTSDSELQGHIVHWMPDDLPGNFIAQWIMQPLSEEGLCITFFAAKGVKGEDLFDPSLKKRDGIFKQYTNSDINCYHFSYYANTPFNLGRITTNLRKNSGFYLISNGAPGITPGSRDPHQVMMMKEGGHIVVNVDGKTILDYTDDGNSYGPVLDGGKLGLRQMQWMKARYRDLKVFNLQ